MVNVRRGGDGRKEIRGGARIGVEDGRSRGVVLWARNRRTQLQKDNLTKIPMQVGIKINLVLCGDLKDSRVNFFALVLQPHP